MVNDDDHFPDNSSESSDTDRMVSAITPTLMMMEMASMTSRMAAHSTIVKRSTQMEMEYAMETIQMTMGMDFLMKWMNFHWTNQSGRILMGMKSETMPTPTLTEMGLTT